MNLSIDKSNDFEFKRRRTTSPLTKRSQTNLSYRRNRKRFAATSKVNPTALFAQRKPQTKKHTTNFAQSAKVTKCNNDQTKKSVLVSNFDIFKKQGFGFAKPTCHPCAMLNLENKVFDYEKQLFPKEKFTILKSVEVELHL
ncbi:hypothetical protein M0812_16435 [Anaeramoeba flamelloides]|uniref:Uncharacterized protein n=1 Tax=Anaeramoeba flamelloides TaxID=1746091 RepID=A0AAV7Z628_9EUKA|nr:hypothetical protein M0812_16435 [Anaeramoeba flamelloides]